MSRKPRVHYPDAIYHVVVRGNNRARVFEDTAEKRKYLDILAYYKQRYAFQLFGVCEKISVSLIFYDNFIRLEAIRGLSWKSSSLSSNIKYIFLHVKKSRRESGFFY